MSVIEATYDLSLGYQSVGEDWRTPNIYVDGRFDLTVDSDTDTLLTRDLAEITVVVERPLQNGGECATLTMTPDEARTMIQVLMQCPELMGEEE